MRSGRLLRLASVVTIAEFTVLSLCYLHAYILSRLQKSHHRLYNLLYTPRE